MRSQSIFQGTTEIKLCKIDVLYPIVMILFVGLSYVGGRDNVFPRILGLVSVNYNTPMVAIAALVRITTNSFTRMPDYHPTIISAVN